MERHMRIHFQKVITGDRTRAWDRRTAGVAGRDQTSSLRVGNEGHVVVSGLDSSEAGFCELHALLHELAKVRLRQTGLEDDRAGDDAPAARAVFSKTSL